MLDRLLALVGSGSIVVIAVNPAFAAMVRGYVASQSQGLAVDCVEQPSPTGIDGVMLGIPVDGDSTCPASG